MHTIATNGIDRDPDYGGVDPTVDDVAVRCATCGRELDGDPDEEPTGDAGRPICGECRREREFFDIDAADGQLDGQWDSDQ